MLHLLIGRRGWRMLQQFIEGQERMTQATDNLAAAADRLTNAVTKLTTDVSADLKALAAEISDPATETTTQAIADRITAQAQKLEDFDASLPPQAATGADTGTAAAGADTSGGDASLA
jgi:hypothetical protein